MAVLVHDDTFEPLRLAIQRGLEEGNALLLLLRGVIRSRLGQDLLQRVSAQACAARISEGYAPAWV